MDSENSSSWRLVPFFRNFSVIKGALVHDDAQASSDAERDDATLYLGWEYFQRYVLSHRVET